MEKEEEKMKEQLLNQERSRRSHNDPSPRTRDAITILDFVAIPPNFDISSFLSLREQVGIPRYKEIDLEQVKMMAEAIKHSPVLAILNNNLMKSEVCLYLLSIIEELGLIVKSINNPIRKSYQEYKNYLNNRPVDSRGRLASFNVVIINIFPLMGDKIIAESIEISQRLQTYQDELDASIEKVPILD